MRLGAGRNPSRKRACRNIRTFAAAAPLVLLVAALGCRAPAPPTGPTAITLQIPDYEAYFDRALSVLRRNDLPPDRVDRPRGLIVTVGTTSGQWFEPWRSDARGKYQVLESSLHTIRRIVTVNLEPLDDAARLAALPRIETTTQPAPAATEQDAAPADPTLIPLVEPQPLGGSYRLVVRVDKERHSAPDRQVTTASGAMALYTDRTPTVQGMRGARSQVVRWVPLGRDPLLEEFLLKKLTHARPDVLVLETAAADAPVAPD